MSLRRPSLLLALLALVSAGCSTSGPSQNPDDVMLRVENASDADFSTVQVTFPSGMTSFGAIAEGATTDYQTVAEAYRYGSVQVIADGQAYDLRAIDYMGETPLPPGRYTFRLALNGDQLTQTLVED